ncbi:MAG: nucleoside deaminase [Candidatus Symbiothrix sp.]|jgi:tRNA(Arg) A34 adenosine deaminase TadA|nr:nucleoside deaminase [Candidatus Symbiothrix sp.]
MDKFDEKMMRKAISLSRISIKKGGGPFGAIIVKDGRIVASGHNMVTLKNDPTAHAEVSVIRRAAKKLNTFDLSGCTIYSSCEPCPMCLSAIYWAHIDKIYYANTKADAKDIGFDDSFIYDQLALPVEKRSIPVVQLLRNEAISAFEIWQQKPDKTKY